MNQVQDTLPPYLNLAHQFLDTNFIESTRQNNFNTLPVINTNPTYDSIVSPDPPMAVDYFSHNLTSKQYHNCWKNVFNNQFMKPYELSNVDNITRLRTFQKTDDLMMFLPTTSQARLENACWRAWYKQLKDLKELHPSEINWFKENDVTVLYGPLIEDGDEDISLKNIEQEERVINQSYASIDIDGDCKMSEDWNTYESPISQSSSPVSSTGDIFSDNDSDVESLLFQRRYSTTSTGTTVSSTSDKIYDNKQIENTECSKIKSILKKRKNYTGRKSPPKKKLSFSHDLISVRFIV